MKSKFWRGLRLFFRGPKARRRLRRLPVRLADRGELTGDALADALLRLRRTIDERRFQDLALAWFRLDEAKAAAVWYDTGMEPHHAAVLPEERALAERLYRLITGAAPTPEDLLAESPPLLAMVRYRLLVAALPGWAAAGGRRAQGALRAAYALMDRAPDVLSPYGRWLLARTVCLAARDHEELARQTERYHVITADHRAPDGASMAFVNGGEFELPLPVPVSAMLDWHGMPTNLEGFKRDAPQEITRFFLRLTPRGQRLFLRAFIRRQEAYQNGYPWRRPAGVTCEGFVCVRTPVLVPSLYIDRQPVTHAMFQEFVHRHRRWLPSRVSSHAVDPDTYLPTWRGDSPPRAAAGEPVTGVSYQACRAYLASVGKQLPTEAWWALALIGAEVPEARYAMAEQRPSMTEEERALYGRRAAARGLYLHLPERVYDFDGCQSLALLQSGRTLTDPRGPATGSAHLWRTPTARGRVPDLAGDANLTFRGALPARRVWAGTGLSGDASSSQLDPDSAEG